MSLSEVIEVALSKTHTENESKLEGELREANSKIQDLRTQMGELRRKSGTRVEEAK